MKVNRSQVVSLLRPLPGKAYRKKGTDQPDSKHRQDPAPVYPSVPVRAVKGNADTESVPPMQR